MKVRKSLIPALLLVIALGCASNPKPITLPTGAIDQTDATVYRILIDAQTVLSELRSAAVVCTSLGVPAGCGKFPLTTFQKKLLNDSIAAYDNTEATYQLYHAKASTDAAGLMAQANSLQSTITGAQASILGKSQVTQ